MRQFLAGQPRLDWAGRARAAVAPRAYVGRARNFFERHGRIKAYRCGLAQGDGEYLHPALAIYFIDNHKDHSGRYANAGLDQRLKHALYWLANGFVALAGNEDLFVLVGIVAENNPAKLEFFASGFRLNPAASEVQGNEEWKAGLY
jgi:hypothetical protein